MRKSNRSYPTFNYDENARNCAPDDFLGQICRTQDGKPVSDEQIQMIITAIKSELSLKNSDVLLELACGNGALSHFLFDSCKAYLGVDLSDYLISVAKKNFEILPHYQFSVQAAKDFVHMAQQAEKYTKVLCYAGFQYFPDNDVVEILSDIYNKFCNVRTIFIGSLPDMDRSHEFYKFRQPSIDELSDCNTALGIWRTKDQFIMFGDNTGWNVKVSTMPTSFYASHYRYDVLLSRK